MAATSLATTLVSNLLVQDILPVIQDQQFRQNVFTAELEKNKGVTLKNGTFYIVSSTDQHSGVYNIAETGTIEAGNFTTAKMSTNAKYAYGFHYFTDVALEGVEGDEGSLANLLVLAGEELDSSMRRHRNRQWEYGFGQGVIAKCSTGATGTTVTVLGESSYYPGTFYIAPGMKLLIGTKTEIEAGTAEEVTVSAITSDTTFTVASSFTYVTSDLIVLKGAYDTTGGAYTEMNGFRDLIDNTSTPYSATMQGITRASNNWVNAQVYKNGGTPVQLTISRLREYVFKASKYGRPNLIMMNYLLYDRIVSLLEDQVRYATVNMGTASFEGIAFASQGGIIPIILSYDMPLTEVYIVDLSSWTIGEMSPLSFMDRDGMVLRNIGGNTNQFGAILKYYGNLICLKPRANARLADQKATA